MAFAFAGKDWNAVRWRVLVTEDDLAVSDILVEMLDVMGYEVCGVCTSEAETVDGYFDLRPDFMLVDDRLRTGTGSAAVSQILEREYVPHVFVSGEAANVLKRHPLATVVRKPYSIRDLERAILSVMGHSAPELAV